MHLPYKSVTGRHTYVIYLMFFNIHAYLGFIQFINFSVWPAEMGKIKADVNVLPHLNVQQPPAKPGTREDQVLLPPFRACPGLVPPFHQGEARLSQGEGSPGQPA